MVMDEVHSMGIRDITICSSSLGTAHDPIIPYIEDGTITMIYSSGVRGNIGRAISMGKLKHTAVMYSHGGRVRAIEEGSIHIDIAFIGAPTTDECGNLRAIGGKSDCGCLSYAYADAQYADKVRCHNGYHGAFPKHTRQHIHGKRGLCLPRGFDRRSRKIATGAAKPTTDQRKLLMAKYCSDFVSCTPYFKDGFIYQTGVGGASIASTVYLAEEMRKRNIHMRLGLGGISAPMVHLMEEGLIELLVDTQDFDLEAVHSIQEHPDKHIEITCSEYANPLNKGAYVNKLDFVILAALEVDIHFNCNVVTDSSGIITGGGKAVILILPRVRNAL